MCILLSTCSHPDYPLILLSNRDEYFMRPTQLASFIEDENTGVTLLSPLDLARPDHGTWIGCSTTGRICVLVNYREASETKALSKVSRGAIPNLFLTSNLSTEEWEAQVHKQTDDFADVGGFSLIFGELKLNSESGKINELKIISNKSKGTVKVFQEENETVGLSNSLYDKPWPKVIQGKKLLDELIKKSIDESWREDALIENCLKLLSTTTPPDLNAWDQGYQKNFEMMPNSIFIPPIKTASYYGEMKLPPVPRGSLRLGGEYYGTRTQTVILVDKAGNLKYIEKNLHSTDQLDEKPSIKVHEFKIKSWNGTTHM